MSGALVALSCGSPATWLSTSTGDLDRAQRDVQSSVVDGARRCIETGAWLAYFKDEWGGVRPVRDPDAPGRDEDWLSLEFSNFVGPRLPVRVLPVLNRVYHLRGSDTGDESELGLTGLRELFVTALYRTGRLEILDDLRADTGGPSVDMPTAPVVSLNEPYVVYGSVHEWMPERSRLELGSRSGVRLTLREAELTMTVILVDARSGAILLSSFERARVVTGRSISQRGRGEDQWVEATPLSRALRICFNKAAYRIATFLRDRKWRGSVLQINGKNILINAGELQGLNNGDVLTVFSSAGLVRDVDGVTVLGELLYGIGSLRVVAAFPSYSLALVEEGCAGIKRDDRIEFVQEPRTIVVPQGCRRSTEDR